MAKVIKCDKCGKYADKIGGPWYSVDVQMYRIENVPNRFDLCHDCACLFVPRAAVGHYEKLWDDANAATRSA